MYLIMLETWYLLGKSITCQPSSMLYIVSQAMMPGKISDSSEAFLLLSYTSFHLSFLPVLPFPFCFIFLLEYILHVSWLFSTHFWWIFYFHRTYEIRRHDREQLRVSMIIDDHSTSSSECLLTTEVIYERNEHNWTKQWVWAGTVKRGWFCICG